MAAAYEQLVSNKTYLVKLNPLKATWSRLLNLFSKELLASRRQCTHIHVCMWRLFLFLTGALRLYNIYGLLCSLCQAKMNTSSLWIFKRYHLVLNIQLLTSHYIQPVIGHRRNLVNRRMTYIYIEQRPTVLFIFFAILMNISHYSLTNTCKQS